MAISHTAAAADANAPKFAGLGIPVSGIGRVQLTHELHRNSETSIYASSRPGLVVKMFDLDCGKPDEVSYGPFLGYKVEAENWADLQGMDELRMRVPTYYGTNIDYEKKHAYIVMEFLQGENLLAWCQRAAEEGYPEGWAWEFRAALHETLEIVNLFHRRGIVLIDFKPDNVIRLLDGAIKFVDMGAFFTPRHNKDTENYVYSATPDYAELIIDTSSVQTGNPLKQGADIFSAGVALFEMATGGSRLGIGDECAEEMLKLPEIFLFRDSQIKDIWKSYPHLKPLLPLLQFQLRDRQILFAEFWHLLKGYLAHEVAGWDEMPEEEHRTMLMDTGVNFISQQLPDALKWLAEPIAHATTLRSFRLATIGDLARQLALPVAPEVQQDLEQNNSVFLKAREIDPHPSFADPINAWEVRLNSSTNHYAISATRLGLIELRDAGLFLFLKKIHQDEWGHRYYQIVDDIEVDFVGDQPLTLQMLREDRGAWIGA